MTRRNYTISLNKENTEQLRSFLKKNGITFSAFIDSVVMESLGSISTFSLKTNMSSMAMLKTMIGMVENVKEELEKKQKKDK